MRVLPSYLRMENLISENKTLKNAYNNIKKERNKQRKIILKKDERILQLEKQIQMLKEKNEYSSNREDLKCILSIHLKRYID